MKPKPGDKVRIDSPLSADNGKTGVVQEPKFGWYDLIRVLLDDGRVVGYRSKCLRLEEVVYVAQECEV